MLRGDGPAPPPAGQVFDAARCDLLRWGLHLVEAKDAEGLKAQGVGGETLARAEEFLAATKRGMGGGYPCKGERKPSGVRKTRENPCRARSRQPLCKLPASSSAAAPRPAGRVGSAAAPGEPR